MKMISRISEFIKFKGLSVRSFEQSIGASDGMIRRAINNGTDIQSKWITSIAEKYPQINLRWLIIGKGDMLAPNDLPTSSSDKMLLDKVIELTKENTILKEEIKRIGEQKKPIKTDYSVSRAAEP